MASQTPRVRLYDPRDAEMPSYSAEQLQSGCLHAAVPPSEQFAVCRVLAGRTQSLDLAGHHLQVVFTESELPDSGAAERPNDVQVGDRIVAVEGEQVAQTRTLFQRGRDASI